MKQTTARYMKQTTASQKDAGEFIFDQVFKATLGYTAEQFVILS